MNFESPPDWSHLGVLFKIFPKKQPNLFNWEIPKPISVFIYLNNNLKNPLAFLIQTKEELWAMILDLYLEA